MSKRKKRTAPISYRPPTGLSAAFRERVDLSGLSTNAYITQAVFNQELPRSKRAASVDQKMVAMLLSQSAKINDRLEALNNLNPTSHEYLLEECRAELVEIRTCLMLALGHSP